LPDEWEEWGRFGKMMWKIYRQHLPVTTKNDINFHEMMERPNPNVTTSLDEAQKYESTLPTINEDRVFKSEDDTMLAVFLKGGLIRPWKTDENQRETLLPQITEAVNNLTEEYPPPRPKEKDSRHISHAQECKKHKKYGVYHFCFWKQQGHSNGKPTLSADILKGATIFEAVSEFHRKVAPLIQTISRLFEPLDPGLYQRYREDYTTWLHKSTLGAIHTCNRTCFLGMALLINLRVEPHKDKQDVKEGWVAMTCIGNFTGGNLVLPALGVQLQHEAGDVIFFRSAVLEHWVAPFKGERTAFVFFTKANMFEDRSF
jgi:hypothetical protein